MKNKNVWDILHVGVLTIVETKTTSLPVLLIQISRGINFTLDGAAAFLLSTTFLLQRLT